MKIIVVGTSCSGKTTLAGRIAKVLNLKHIELDRLYWLPNWERNSRENFLKLALEEMQDDNWIADGNYSSVRDSLWPKADTIIWLDYSLPLSLWRAFMRMVRKEEQAEGCTDSWLRNFFTKESIFLWILKNHYKKKRDYEKIMREQTYPHLRFIRLKQEGDLNDVIREIGSN